MGRFDALKIIDFDHLEFAVGDLEKASIIWLRAGFEKIATREIFERQLRSYLFSVNQTHVLLSASTSRTDPVSKFVQTHGDGIFNIAFRCEDAVATLDITANRGAEVVETPKSYRREFGNVQSAAIRALGNTRHTFISRQGSLFAEGFEIPIKAPRRPGAIRRLDHLSYNVEGNRLEHWTSFYEKILGLVCAESLMVETSRGNVRSQLLQSPTGLIPIRISEPASERNPVQDYLDINHGPGIQHAAFSTENILSTLRHLRREGVAFRKLPPPRPEELQGLDFTSAELQEAALSLERDGEYFLVHAYTQNLAGPFFMEILQRNQYQGPGLKPFQQLLETLG